MILAVLHQKAGVGKTTLAVHLAMGIALQGARVLLVDADPQGSARDWAAARFKSGYGARGSPADSGPAEINLPEQILTEDVKVLFGQLSSIFINSGGARYLPERN